MEPYALVAGIQVGDHYPVRLMGIINVCMTFDPHDPVSFPNS